MDSYAELARELFEIMDTQKHRPPHPEMSKMMHGEMAVIRLLSAQGMLLAGDISRSLKMNTSRVAAVLSSLEKKALIVRGEDPQDRRRVLVQLTQAGREFDDRKRAEIQSHMRWMLTQLGPCDAREYVRLTRRAMEIMNKEELDEEQTN